MYTMATVVVENAAYCYDKEYTYYIPNRMEPGVQAGCRVRVPFGRGNRGRTGLILEVTQTAERDEKAKPVAALLDSQPVLDCEGLLLLRYLREHTFCTWFDALKTLIPAGIGIRPQLRYRATGRDVEGLSPRQLEVVEFLRSKRNGAEEKDLSEKTGMEPDDPEMGFLLAGKWIEVEELLKQRVMDGKSVMVRLLEEAQPSSPLTKRQKEAVEFLRENGAVSLKELCYYLAMTKVVADKLRDRGVVEFFDTPRFRNPYGDEVVAAETPPSLSPEQEKALNELENMLSYPDHKPVLLYGVTGSGKTQVFLALIEKVLARGESVIVLVPEISLTAQTVQAFHRRFGARVAVIHSGLSLGERMDEWRRVRESRADIVIGTRSAVFAPVKNLGLIVMDEEQEHTYHSEKSPRFHARDIARFRCAKHGAMLLLASATPSVESYHYAKTGRYGFVALEERFGAAELPDVYMIDMRDGENLSDSPIFSQRLLEELHYNLTHKEQSILLLNRRGYSTLIRCSICGHVEECPQCSVSLTYHAVNNGLICHYCGFTKKKPDKCGECESELIRYNGFGTQKLQEELERIYPDARILRVDMDTTLSKFSHERLFNSFLAKEYDIMIGTQMVAKGLNFPQVTLVGVLAADQSLYAMDFRSYERSFALLTQVVGRAGRGDHRGRALIQTYSPEHPIIGLAAEQDYPGYFAQEIISRKYHLYPPFCTMAGIGFSSPNPEEVKEWARRFLEQFRELAQNYPELPIRALGPVAADTQKAVGKYRQKLIIKCKNNSRTRALFRETLEWFTAECKTVSIFIDMYYDRL